MTVAQTYVQSCTLILRHRVFLPEQVDMDDIVEALAKVQTRVRDLGRLKTD